MRTTVPETTTITCDNCGCNLRNNALVTLSLNHMLGGTAMDLCYPCADQVLEPLPPRFALKLHSAIGYKVPSLSAGPTDHPAP